MKTKKMVRTAWGMQYVLMTLLLSVFLLASCEKDNEIEVDEDVVITDVIDEDEKAEANDEESNDESGDTSEEESEEEDVVDSENSEDEETVSEEEVEEEVIEEEPVEEEEEVTPVEDPGNQEHETTGGDDFDIIYKPESSVYFDISKSDLTGISNIKVIGISKTLWLGVGSLETHKKYILVDISNSNAKVTVGGINNTIEVLGLESPSTKRLIVFDKDPASSQIRKEGGRVYVEIVPVVDDKNSSNTKVLVYLGEESDLSEDYIEEQHTRVMKVNVENDIW